MAIFWLDLVRFADTTGYHGDNHVDLYLFRDYVIRAFNDNKPFDRFTIEQLAGDLLAGATDETRIASGYNRLLQTTQEGGGRPRNTWPSIRRTACGTCRRSGSGRPSAAPSAMTTSSTRIKTREFYSLAAFFADVKETAVGVQEPTSSRRRHRPKLLRADRSASSPR